MALGGQQPGWVATDGSCDAMHNAEELTEFGLLVEPRLKVADPLRAYRVARPVARFPEPTGLVIEVVTDVGAIVGQIVFVLTIPEEVIETLVVREVLDRRQFETRERHVVGVEVNGNDSLGAVHKVVEHVAATAGDRQQLRFGTDAQGFGVDPRVLPDLVVYKAPEPKREHPLEHASAAG